MRRPDSSAWARQGWTALVLSALAACAPPETVEPAGVGGATDDGTTGPWALGQPMSTRAEIEGRSDGAHTYMSASLLTDGSILTGGSRGYQTLSPDGEVLFESAFPNVASVALDDETNVAWISVPDETRVVQLDVADPLEPVILGEFPTLGARENHRISVHRGLTILGTDESAILYDSTGAIRAELPATSAYGVAIHGYRAIVADEEQLVVYDVSSPDLPIEVARATLPAPGFDIAFDGERIAVALGGAGVDVFLLDEADALTPHGHVDLPSSTYDVDLDGDLVWIAAWSVVALAQITDDGVTPLGHQPTAQYALGITARDGTAVAAELDVLQIIDSVPSVAGPEIHVGTDTVFFADDTPVAVTVTNHGAYPLHLELDPTGPFTLDWTAATIAVGETATVTVTPTTSDASGQIRWTSDDPDEPSGTIPVVQASGVVGEPHPNFEANAFNWPDDTLRPMTNRDLLGKVVLFVYFKVDCLVCAMEVPDLHATLEVMVADEPDFQVVLVNEDNAGLDPAWTFVDTLQLPYTTVLDTGWSMYESYGDVQDASTALSVPLHVVMDREGVVTWLQYEADIDGITAAVDAALAR